MSESYLRLVATITYWLNIAMVSLALSSFVIGWLSNSYVSFPHIVSTVAYAGLVLYWRFWYFFALPAFYLGQDTNAPRRHMLLTALSAVVILLIKFFYGYQLPD